MTANQGVSRAQREALRWLLDHPGEELFAYYDSRRGGTWGRERVSTRGAAGRMYYRLEAAGLVTGSRAIPIVTAAGEGAAK